MNLYDVYRYGDYYTTVSATSEAEAIDMAAGSYDRGFSAEIRPRCAMQNAVIGC